MCFTKITTQGIRNLEPVTFLPGKEINFFSGKNGAGKTSFLESICLLSTGRSFRNNTKQNYINDHSAYCVGYGEWEHNDKTSKIGVKRDKNKNIEIHLNREKQKNLSQISQLFAIKVLTTEVFSVITGTAEQRRNMIDWVLFHVEHNFREHKNTYQKALKNRNSLLRSWKNTDRIKNKRALSYWDDLLIEEANQINSLRINSINDLQNKIQQLSGLPLEKILSGKVEIKYSQGWPADKTLTACLQNNFDKDLSKGFTQYGAHRFDLHLTTRKQKASDLLSRGELKTLAIACQLIQIKTLTQQNIPVVVLIDDLFAELDTQHANWCLDTLNQMSQAQKFITGVTIPKEIRDQYSEKGMRWFHVEHGKITNNDLKTD